MKKKILLTLASCFILSLHAFAMEPGCGDVGSYEDGDSVENYREDGESAENSGEVEEVEEYVDEFGNPIN